jgi:CheY-like chemotaxis protein
MPDVDGLSLVTAFRHRASTAHTPVIVLSGNDDDATRSRALAAGAADYLVKLPTKGVLVACLDRHLSVRTASPLAPVAPSTDDASDAPLDSEFLATYRDENAADPDETLRELLEVFFRDAERLIGDLRRAAMAGFTAAVPRVAHALKGCALAAGARAIAGVCAQLETGTLSAAEGVARLEVELTRVRAAAAYARPEGGQSDTVLARQSLRACSSEAEPR